MKRNDISSLHSFSIKELKEKLKTLIAEHEKARSERVAGKLKNISSVYSLRKDTARVKTIIRKKELEENVQSISQQ